MIGEGRLCPQGLKYGVLYGAFQKQGALFGSPLIRIIVYGILFGALVLETFI